MREHIVITCGTAAGAAGLELERKRAAEIKNLETRLACAGQTGDPALIAKLDHARDEIHIVALDVDQGNSYTLNTPLTNLVPTWPVGHFVPTRMPGPDMVGRIMAGLHRGRFEYLNGEAVRALGTIDNASGGSRSNGWIAAELNRDLIEKEIRNRIEGILKRRRLLARRLDENIGVILVVGCFGGFGSGADHLVGRLVQDVARQMQVSIDFLRVLLVPANNAPKDAENTKALAHGVLTELAAHATGLHWHRENGPEANGNEMAKTKPVPTILVSDTNHAPGQPQALSVENFNGMVAEFLRAFVLTDLGPRLSALYADFVIPAERLTISGEPKAARSIGLSIIHLDRARLLAFANSKLADQVLSASLMPVAEEDLDRDVRAFFEAQQFVVGAGVRQLPDRLLDPGDGRLGIVGVERFRHVFGNNVAELRGTELLTGAGQRCRLSVQQAGDLDAALAGRAGMAVQAFVDQARKKTDELVRDRQAGVAAAKQWLEKVISVVDNMKTEATNDLPQLEEGFGRYEQRVEHWESVYLPQLRKKNSFYHMIKRKKIEGHADEYRRCLEERRVSEMRLASHRTAIQVLDALVTPLKARLAELQVALDNVTAERDAARAEVERLAQHRPDFSCPTGLPLISGRADLEAYYARLLPAGGETQAAADVHGRLLQVGDLLTLASDPEPLHTQLATVVERTFRDRVEALHVVTELRRRFPDRETLGAVLRRRVHESFEYVQLRDSCDQEQGLALVRLVGVDESRVGDLPEILGRYDYPRGAPFQAVNTSDPERIVFLQFRAVFPISDLSHFARFREADCKATAANAFEKYHEVVGERSLPGPGSLLPLAFVRMLVFKAWRCGRLECQESDGVLRLRSADGAEQPLPLGPNLEVLRGTEGYRRAVEVTSHYSSLYFKEGPDAIRNKLQRLAEVRAGQQGPADAVEHRLAALVNAETEVALERELTWWLKNSVPAAMQWHNGLDGSGGLPPV